MPAGYARARSLISHFIDRPEKKEWVVKENRWSWLPAFMPGVVQQIAERRARHGAAWVAECWQHGVVEGQPGWFWAAEGPLTVGTPIDGEVLAKYYAVQATFPKAVMVDMREPPRAAG